ncbi:hypothetical protein HU200_046188 [Digitaria exilis]|uniref:Uncharacterized protein n=1 Tax=Digitaria exilis TaxID=1010633 RepID=A0A835AWG7_9POAL|nr:hypothetical protein HU200_046188 [Digitaria exilis]
MLKRILLSSFVNVPLAKIVGFFFWLSNGTFNDSLWTWSSGLENDLVLQFRWRHVFFL